MMFKVRKSILTVSRSRLEIQVNCHDSFHLPTDVKCQINNDFQKQFKIPAVSRLAINKARFILFDAEDTFFQTRKKFCDVKSLGNLSEKLSRRENFFATTFLASWEKSFDIINKP